MRRVFKRLVNQEVCEELGACVHLIEILVWHLGGSDGRADEFLHSGLITREEEKFTPERVELDELSPRKREGRGEVAEIG